MKKIFYSGWWISLILIIFSAGILIFFEKITKLANGCFDITCPRNPLFTPLIDNLIVLLTFYIVPLIAFCLIISLIVVLFTDKNK